MLWKRRWSEDTLEKERSEDALEKEGSEDALEKEGSEDALEKEGKALRKGTKEASTTGRPTAPSTLSARRAR